MAMATTYAPLSAPEHSAHLRKAVIAQRSAPPSSGTISSSTAPPPGWFSASSLPQRDPLTATLAAFGTYFIGFVGRPIGAAIFGHYGDRIGRKATLIATLL